MKENILFWNNIPLNEADDLSAGASQQPSPGNSSNTAILDESYDDDVEEKENPKTINLKISIPARPNSFQYIMEPVRQGKADHMFGIKHFTTDPLREIDGVTNLAKKYLGDASIVEFIQSCFQTAEGHDFANIDSREVEPNNVVSTARNRVNGMNTEETQLGVFDRNDDIDHITKYGRLHPYIVKPEDRDEFASGANRNRPDVDESYNPVFVDYFAQDQPEDPYKKHTDADEETEKLGKLVEYFGEALAKVNELINIQIGGVDTDNFSDLFMDLFSKIAIEDRDPDAVIEQIPATVNSIKGIFNKMFSNHEKMRFMNLYRERCKNLADQADSCVNGHIEAFCQKFPKSPMRKEKLLMLWKGYSIEIHKDIDNFASQLVNGEGYQYFKTVLLSTIPSLFGAMLVAIKFMEARTGVKMFSLKDFAGSKEDSAEQTLRKTRLENDKLKAEREASYQKSYTDNIIRCKGVDAHVEKLKKIDADEKLSSSEKLSQMEDYLKARNL